MQPALEIRNNVGVAMALNTVGDALEQYMIDHPDAAQVRTAILRYTAPIWGYCPSSQRMTHADIAAGIAFLKTVPIAQLETALEAQQAWFAQMGIGGSIKRTNRSYLKRLIDWSKAIAAPPQRHRQQQQHPIAPYRFRTVLATHGVLYEQQDRPKRKVGQAVKLTAQELAEAPLQPLQMELQGLAAWLERQGFAAQSIVMTIASVLEFLGWCHRIEAIPDQALNLALCTGIHTIQPQMSSFSGEAAYQHYFTAQLQAKEQAKQQAAETIQRITAFFAFRSASPSSIANHTTKFIRVAKYLHRNITDRTLQGETYNDIPIVTRLRLYRNQACADRAKTSELIPFGAKSIAWERWLEVVEKARLEADMTVTCQLNAKTGIVSYTPRPAQAIAHSLQTFLILAFLSVRPPDRARTLYELEVGRTLLQGKYDGMFTPLDKLSDPTQAEWILRLKPEDYKTGKIYGEFYSIIKNVEFSDGKHLYDYIDRWLNQYRMALAPNHNRFFTTASTNPKFRGNPLTSQSIRSAIQHMTYRFTGIGVTTKDIRRMYVTHLKEIGASEAILEAACREMHHSREMQAEVYNKQSGYSKSAPALALNQSLFQQVQSHPYGLSQYNKGQ